jgi:hypothetical protein
MPRFWLSGPRLLNGLIRPGISFSGRELAAWRKKAPKVFGGRNVGHLPAPGRRHDVGEVVVSCLLVAKDSQ